jgi:hypothetical protein
LIASDAQAKRGASAPRFRFGPSSHSIGMKRAVETSVGIISQSVQYWLASLRFFAHVVNVTSDRSKLTLPAERQDVAMSLEATDLASNRPRNGSAAESALLRRIDLTTLRLFTAVCEEKDQLSGPLAGISRYRT